MAIAYYGDRISPHMTDTPEGFLICHDVPIARTGPQDYLAREMMLDGDPERVVTVQRYPEDVFEAATLASFEGKPICDGHPPENVGPENYAAYTKGHVQNVRRDGDYIVADLYINDANLANEVRNNVKREVSCGYLCNYVPDGAGYKQSRIRGITSYIKQAETAANATKAARTATQQMEQAQKAASASTDTLSRSLKSLVGGYLGLQGLRSVLNLSDTITATTARLDMMNDGLQTTAELNSMIWQSAQRTRGAYAGTASFVAQLGNLAGNAFSSNAEIVAFAEQINKQIALSGTSTAGASAAILQLTQGLSSGALRGEELNSVLEQTPMIAKTIADYMGVTTGEMRELASQGAVTAEVVKNAMFAAADETNAKFEQTPYTWSQVWTQAQNIMIQAFQPALDMVGQMSDWLGNNMDTAIAAFYGLAAAVAVYTAATWLASAANRKFIANLMKNPFLWIAVAIGFVVAAIYQWIQAVGGLEAAWLIAKDTVLSAWEELQYGAQSVATGVANWMSQMAINVINAVNAMVNGAIDGINGLIGHVNATTATVPAGPAPLSLSPPPST